MVCAVAAVEDVCRAVGGRLLREDGEIVCELGSVDGAKLEILAREFVPQGGVVYGNGVSMWKGVRGLRLAVWNTQGCLELVEELAESLVGELEELGLEHDRSFWVAGYARGARGGGEGLYTVGVELSPTIPSHLLRPTIEVMLAIRDRLYEEVSKCARA
jgi:hypothetical protein